MDKFFCYLEKLTEIVFEPTHGDRTGLAVQPINHSATLYVQPSKYEFWSLFDFWFQSILILIDP